MKHSIILLILLSISISIKAQISKIKYFPKGIEFSVNKGFQSCLSSSSFFAKRIINRNSIALNPNQFKKFEIDFKDDSMTIFFESKSSLREKNTKKNGSKQVEKEIAIYNFKKAYSLNDTTHTLLTIIGKEGGTTIQFFKGKNKTIQINKDEKYVFYIKYRKHIVPKQKTYKGIKYPSNKMKKKWKI